MKGRYLRIIIFIFPDNSKTKSSNDFFLIELKVLLEKKALQKIGTF